MESWTYDWTLGFQGFLFDVFPDTCQVAVQSFFVALVDDVDEVFQLFTNALHMTFGTRVEKDFPKEAVVFAQHALSYFQMAFECRARCILMFHHRSKGESRHERNTERVGHGLVVFLERIFADM